jgi:hypothetical protein
MRVYMDPRKPAQPSLDSQLVFGSPYEVVLSSEPLNIGFDLGTSVVVAVPFDSGSVTVQPLPPVPPWFIPPAPAQFR